MPADGGAAGKAVIDYCRSFEIERDAKSYFRRLERQKQLPSSEDIAERSRQAGQPLTVQQVAERDWSIRRETNKGAPQRCKVLGGTVEGTVANIVFEADLAGKRQRGTAAVTLGDGKWRVRDHGDWSVVR